MNQAHPHPRPDPGEELPGEVDERWLIRTMTPADVDAIVALDARESPHPRPSYYRDKIAACVSEPGLNTSLLAEQDGAPVGFLIGRLFFGEFGIPATRAVLDTLGVHPSFRRQGVASVLLEQYRKNLSALRVDTIDTLVDWDRFDLLAFFKRHGFRPSRNVDLVWNLERYPFAASPRGVDVRDAGEADVEVIMGIDTEAVGEARPEYIATKCRAARKHPARHRMLVAEVGGEPAGFLDAAVFHGEFGIDSLRGVIDTLGVRERFRHRGVASALLQHLLAWLETQGATEMETLCLWNDWELLPFFAYVGFRPSARMNLEWRIG